MACGWPVACVLLYGLSCPPIIKRCVGELPSDLYAAPFGCLSWSCVQATANSTLKVGSNSMGPTVTLPQRFQPRIKPHDMNPGINHAFILSADVSLSSNWHTS
jgi:hypothetical protein